MSDNLFVALGKLGKALNGINAFRGTTVPAYAAAVPAQVDFQTYPTVGSEAVDALNALATSNQLKVAQQALQGTADDLLVAVVNVLSGQLSNTDPNASLAYLVATTADTIGQNTLSATPTVVAGNVGNGSIVVSLLRDDGVALQMALAETLAAACSSDAVLGKATAGSEVFLVSGAPAQRDPLSPLYPQGSGSVNTITSTDATVYNAATNLTNNGGLELWTANTPAQFAIVAGTAGTEIQKDTTHVYSGTAAANLVGATGTNLVFEQVFGSGAGGTAATLLPGTSYAFNLLAKASGALGSGSFTVELYDKTGAAVMQDESGANNATTVLCTALTTSFAAFHGVFRTPKVLPASYSLRIVCASIPAGNVYLDHLALTEMTRLYAGGPAVAIFSGSANWAQKDGWTVAIANNYSCTWATMLQRLFDLNSQNLVFPNSGSPSQADSLLT